MSIQIEPPWYPIVYVRGYAMTAGERDQVFHDAYYGFGITSVEKRQAPPPRYFEADIFEGLLIRLMKDHGYIDSTNAGLRREKVNPSRSIWVSRFYDPDYFSDSVRGIVEHAQDLYDLICTDIPKRLEERGVDLKGYKVILIAHSMGGLVCRALIQNLLPKNDKDPKSLIHRFVTMGTPHRGIDLGAIPDILEDRVVTSLNPFDASIFKEPRMHEYLDLDDRYDVHSLGPDDRFPIKRCLCLIGSDWSSYGLVRRLTGGFSDGLVKQDRAYLVSGPRPSADEAGEIGDYDDQHRAYWANVHRAHSGYRGIVNSYESYENIQRFLFGDVIFHLTLKDIELRTEINPEYTYFYDFEFLLSIRGTSSYLHRRQQDPCENAIRVKIDKDSKPPKALDLHTAFMNMGLAPEDSPHAYFQGRFQLSERRVKPGWLWDRDYPTSVIYNETLEVRVPKDVWVTKRVEYRWLSDRVDRSDEGWQQAESSDHAFQIPMREAKAFAAKLVIEAGRWPDPDRTKD
jgi:pimeloyl-ACP methyl ester carboxylesterase